MKKSFILLSLFLVLCSISVLAADGINYKIIEEKHDLNEHYIIFELENEGLLSKDVTPILELVSELNGFEIVDYKIEKVIEMQKTEERPIKEYLCFEDSSRSEDIGTFENCHYETIDYETISYTKRVYTKIPTINNKIFNGANLQPINNLNIGGSNKIYLKFSWQTPILNTPKGFGTEGYGSINPTFWWNSTWLFRKQLNLTNTSHTNEPMIIEINEICGGYCISGAVDLRVFDNTTQTLLDYEFLNTTTQHTKGTFQSPTYIQFIIPDASHDIFIYYGNTNASAVDTYVFNYTAIFMQKTYVDWFEPMDTGQHGVNELYYIDDGVSNKSMGISSGGYNALSVDSDTEFNIMFYDQENTSTGRNHFWYFAGDGSKNIFFYGRYDHNPSTYGVFTQTTWTDTGVTRTSGWHNLRAHVVWGEHIDWYLDGVFVANQTDAGGNQIPEFSTSLRPFSDSAALTMYLDNIRNGWQPINQYLEPNKPLFFEVEEVPEEVEEGVSVIGTIDCDYNSQPYIKLINKIDWLCTINTNTTNATDYRCYSKVVVNGDTIQINPDDKLIDDVGLIDYFTPQPPTSQIQRVKAYFTTEDLRPDKAANFSVICSGEHQNLEYTAEVTPTYKDTEEILDRTTWLGDNSTYLLVGLVIIMIVLFVFIIIWRLQQ